MQSKDVLDKSRVTSLQKYGTEYPNQSEIVKSKIDASTLEHYGVNRACKLDEFKQKL